MPEHNLDAVAARKLDDGHLAALGRCGGARLKHFRDGQKLIAVGDR